MSSLVSLFKKTEKVSKNQVPAPQNINFKTIEENLDNDKFFSCPKCKDRISIILNPANFVLSYKCKNNHIESNINYSNFYSEKYISHPLEIFCQLCKKEKLQSNNILSCNTCHLQLCINCILKHKLLYTHNNYSIVDNSINKCAKHEIDISQYCKTCRKNLCVFCLKKEENKNDHYKHNIINFSELIPDKTEIQNNNLKFEKKIQNNNAIIDKLNEWKKEMCSLIDDIINNLNCEIMIYKMIIQNFNWKFLDYNNYLNYNNAIENIEKYNENLEEFKNSKMFIQQTNSITNYLFGINNKKIDNNNNINEKEDEKENNIINNNIEEINNINFIIDGNKNKKNEEPNFNILEILQKQNAILCSKKNIFSYSIDDNEIKKINEYKLENEFIIDNNNNKNNNKEIYHNLINLKNSLFDKLNNYNILIWKMENDLKKDKLFNIINNENKNIINKENEIINIKNDNNIKYKELENKVDINDNRENREINYKEELKYNKMEIIPEEKEKKLEESKQNDNNEIVNNNLNKTNNNNNNEYSERSKLINLNNNNNSNESDGYLLFGNSNSISNINYNIGENNNNYLFGRPLNNTTFENTYFNNNNFNESLSNIFSSNNFNRRNEEEKEEEYVYISSTGKKYHGRSQCGRMKSSRKVTLSTAERMGLEPCMRCY